MPKAKVPAPRAQAVLAARAASDKLAHDIRVLEVGALIQITDYFVVCSGTTDRQVRAIGDAVEDALREFGVKALRREGERESRWLLLDFVDIVVHVFTEEDRAYYELERLWKDAPEVLWEPAKTPAVKKAARSS